MLEEKEENEEEKERDTNNKGSRIKETAESRKRTLKRSHKVVSGLFLFTTSRKTGLARRRTNGSCTEALE